MSTAAVIKSLRALVNLSTLLGASGFTVTTATATAHTRGLEVHLDRDGTPARFVAETLGFEGIEAADKAGDPTTGDPYTVVRAKWRGWDVTMFGPQVAAKAVTP